MGHVESRFGPDGDSASVDARQVHGLRQTYHRLRNRFGRTRWYSKVTGLKWKLHSVRDEDINTDDASAPTPVAIAGPLTHARARKINHQVLILMQDWCTVCVERTISSEIVLDAPDGTPR